MAILKFVLIAHLIIYGFSDLIGCIRFLIDVRKWHNQETKVEIIPSNEREVTENERTGNNGTGDRGNNDGDTGDGTRDRDNNDSTGDSDGDNNNSDRYDW